MQKIYTSASKLIFLVIGITACITFATGLLESQDFMILASLAFTYYFTKKSDQIQQ